MCVDIFISLFTYLCVLIYFLCSSFFSMSSLLYISITSIMVSANASVICYPVLVSFFFFPFYIFDMTYVV